MATENIDLTCNEVILEHCIEPENPPATGKIVHFGQTLEAQGAAGPTPKTRPHSSFFPLTAAVTKVGEKARRECGRRKSAPSSDFHERKRSRLDPENVNSGQSSTSAFENRDPEDPLHNILPVEVRWIILKRFHASELLRLRLVSRLWKDTVDSFHKVSARIDGTQKEFSGQCTLSMKSCKLISVQNPAHRSLFNSSCPDKVQVLQGICQINFDEMISQWSHLTRLEICWRSIMKNMLCDKKKPVWKSGYSTLTTELPYLKSLKVEVLISDSLGKTTMLRISSNLTKITSYEYPSIRSFQVSFVGFRELHAQERHLSILLPFIRRNASTLYSIEFSLNYASQVSYPPIHPRHILFCVPANIKYYYKSPYSANEGHLITTRLQRPAGDSLAMWTEMLGNTRTLELAITTRFLNWTIRHLDFFTPTISTFAKFLRCLDLMNVTMYDSGSHSTATQIDANVFAVCVQLAQLRFYRAPIIFHEDEVDPATEIINLHQLPSSLVDLTIDGLPVSSIEILATIKKLRRLSSFRYFQSQVPRRNILENNGINWEILSTMMQHEKLTFVRVHATSLAQQLTYDMYDEAIKSFAAEYGWNTNGITVGYMNMFEVMLTKGNEFLK